MENLRVWLQNLGKKSKRISILIDYLLHSNEDETKDVDMDEQQQQGDDDDDDNVVIPGAGPIAMHTSNKDDPLLEIKDDVNIFFLISSRISFF